MVETHTVIFSHELKGIWFTANYRLEKWEKARRVKQARRISWAKFHACPQYEKATLTVKVINRTGRRFDPLNAADIIKPLSDGAIDAGILPDDDEKHLISTTIIGGHEKGNPSHEIIFTFTKIG